VDTLLSKKEGANEARRKYESGEPSGRIGLSFCEAPSRRFEIDRFQGEELMEQTLTFENVAMYRVAGHGIRRTNCRTLTLRTEQKYAQFNDAIKYEYLEKRKRYPREGYLTDKDKWLRVVSLASAIDPDFFMMPDGPNLLRSRYPSYDMRYITDFEDKMTMAKVVALFSVGTGHRGACGCHWCSHRMEDLTAPPNSVGPTGTSEAITSAS
jgi:hypothetical protein